MGVTMSDQADTINSLQAQLDYYQSQPMVESVSIAEVDSLDEEEVKIHEQEKFQALYSYCFFLARERDMLENHITALSMCERKTMEISAQHQELTKSLLALME